MTFPTRISNVTRVVKGGSHNTQVERKGDGAEGIGNALTGATTRAVERGQ